MLVDISSRQPIRKNIPIPQTLKIVNMINDKCFAEFIRQNVPSQYIFTYI